MFDELWVELETGGVFFERQWRRRRHPGNATQLPAIHGSPEHDPQHSDDREDHEGSHVIPQVQPIRGMRSRELKERVSEVVEDDVNTPASEVNNERPSGYREHKVS